MDRGSAVPGTRYLIANKTFCSQAAVVWVLNTKENGMSNNQEFRKRVIELTLHFGQKQKALIGSFNLISTTIVHSGGNETIEKEFQNYELYLNSLELSIDQYFSSMLLINLISEIECYLTNIIKELISIFPEKLGKEKVDLKTVLKLSKDEIIQNAAERYIDEIMRKRPKEYLDEIGNILSIGKLDLTEDWRTFIEAKARRDVGVHNNWKINDTYKRKIKEVGINEIPSTVVPDFNYILTICKCGFRISDDIRERINKKYS